MDELNRQRIIRDGCGMDSGIQSGIGSVPRQAAGDGSLGSWKALTRVSGDTRWHRLAEVIRGVTLFNGVVESRNYRRILHTLLLTISLFLLV